MAHFHINGGLHLLKPGIVFKRTGLLTLPHRDRFDPARHHDIGEARIDLLGCHGNRLQTRRAKATHRCARRFNGQSREHRCHPRQIKALLAGLISGTQNHIVDPGRIHLGISIQQRIDEVRHHVIGPGEVKTAAERLGQTGADAIDNHSVRHDENPCENKGGLGGGRPYPNLLSVKSKC